MDVTKLSTPATALGFVAPKPKSEVDQPVTTKKTQSSETKNAPTASKNEEVSKQEPTSPSNKLDFDSSAATARATLPTGLINDEALFVALQISGESADFDLASVIGPNTTADLAPVIVAAEFVVPTITFAPQATPVQDLVRGGSTPTAATSTGAPQASVPGKGILGLANGTPVQPNPLLTFSTNGAGQLDDVGKKQFLAWAQSIAVDRVTPEELAGLAATDPMTPEEYKEMVNYYANLPQMVTGSGVPPKNLGRPDTATDSAAMLAQEAGIDPALPLSPDAPISSVVVQNPSNSLTEQEELEYKIKINYQAPSDPKNVKVAEAVQTSATVQATSTAPIAGTSKTDPKPATLLGKSKVDDRSDVANLADADIAIEPTVKESATPSFIVDEDAGAASLLDLIKESKTDKAEVNELASDEAPLHAVMDGKIQTTKLDEASIKPRVLNEKETSSVLSQVADRMELLAATKPRNGVTIHLDPFDLGQITLNVKGAGNEVAAEVTASNDSVRAAIEANRGQLAHNLESRGLSLNQLTVNVSTDAKQAFADAQAQREQLMNTLMSSRPGFDSDQNGGAIMTPDQARSIRMSATGMDFWI